MTILSWIKDERRKRNAIAELQQLDDSQLKDIGIARCDIAWVVRRERDRAAKNGI